MSHNLVSPERHRLGFVGTGVMGAGMVANLVRAGYRVTVYNRSPAKTVSLVGLGAKAVSSLAEVATSADIVLLSLPDDAAVEQVIFTEQGLSQHLPRGSVVIDTSTIRAASAKAFADRLLASDIAFLDAPVSGGDKGSREGTLAIMVGGESKIFERCRPIFEALGKKITFLGSSGSGQICKACNQLAAVATMLGVAEAMALAKRAQVSPELVREVLLSGSASSTVLERNGKKLLDQTFEPGFKVELMQKDIRIVLDNAAVHGSFAPMSALASQLFAAHAHAGSSQLDWSSIGVLFERLSGIKETPSGEPW